MASKSTYSIGRRGKVRRVRRDREEKIQESRAACLREKAGEKHGGRRSREAG